MGSVIRTHKPRRKDMLVDLSASDAFMYVLPTLDAKLLYDPKYQHCSIFRSCRFFASTANSQEDS